MYIRCEAELILLLGNAAYLLVLVCLSFVDLVFIILFHYLSYI